MKIEKKKIEEYKNFTLYGIYKNNKLLYKTTQSNIKNRLETRELNKRGVKESVENTLNV